MKTTLLSAALLVLATAAFAQVPEGPYGSPQDPSYGQGPYNPRDSSYREDEGPGRGVARISVINGDVSVRRGDTGDVSAAAINAPLMAQDALLTSSSSHAELQFDYANMLRVAPNSEVRMGDLDNGHYQIQLAIGTVTFTVLRDSRAQVEISTPNVSVRPLRKGAYRITVREDGSSEIIVRSGEAEVYTPRGSQSLRPGQMMMVRGTQPDVEFQLVAAPQLDEWDHWNQHRDQELASAKSYRYVSPDVYGAEDLDPYGNWVYEPSYGYVWSPTVASGWAPYRYGRWVWEDWYGWTWVSYDPWGWAPYHYGRWFYGSRGWCWWPGAIRSHYYWRPALVAFFGFGGGGGFGFGFGHVGWVPLAPFEPIHPWWGRWGGYGRNTFVNNTVVNNINITNVYRNARINNGVTAVGSQDFGRHTGRFTPVSGSQIGQAGLVRGMLPVTPDRVSLRLADRQVNTASLPQARAHSFFSRGGPVRTQRTPFDQQQRAVEQASRSVFAGRSGGFGRQSAVVPGGNSAAVNSGNGWRGMANRGAEPQAGNSPASRAPLVRSDNGWHRVGEPSQPSIQNAPPTAPNNGAAHGWSRFGEPIHSGTSAPQAVPRNSAPMDSGNRWGGSRPQAQAPMQPIDRGGRPSGGNWQHFNPGQGAPDASDAPRSETRWGRGSDAVRISPPIVRERSYSPPVQPQAQPRSYGGGFGGGRSEMPRMEAPRSYGGGGFGGGRSEAPRMEAPRSYGGGGFGGGRSEAPRMEAPRSNGGGGGFSGGGPRGAPSWGGGGGSHGGGGGAPRGGGNGGGDGGAHGGGGGHRR